MRAKRRLPTPTPQPTAILLKVHSICRQVMDDGPDKKVIEDLDRGQNKDSPEAKALDLEERPKWTS